jgi:hypothetical protein
MIQPTPWDIPFAVALLVQATKLGDWILLPDQKKAVQDCFDTVALKIDDVKPLSWFKSFKSNWKQHFVICFGVGLCVLAILSFVNDWHYLTASYKGSSIVPSIIVWVGLALVPAVGVYAIVRLGEDLVNWLYSDGRFRPFFVRYLILLVSPIAFGMAIVALLFVIGEVSAFFQAKLGPIIHFDGLLAVVWWIVLSVVGLIIWAIGLVLVLLAIFYGPAWLVIVRVRARHNSNAMCRA